MGPKPGEPDVVLVVDFGAQYAQLIARRVREANVYSEIVPRDMPVADMLARKPKGIIFSGGPASVHVEGAPSTWTEAGPPEKMIPLGRRASISATGMSRGTISE